MADPLATDLYELNMAASYLRRRMEAPATFSLFVRRLPPGRGFLVAAGEYLRDNHPKLFHEAETRDHFNQEMFHGFDFDGTMLRIGSMNMTLHGVEDPDIRYKDSLAQEHAGDTDKYSLVLANPPFAGSLDYETTAKDLLARKGEMELGKVVEDRLQKMTADKKEVAAAQLLLQVVRSKLTSKQASYIGVPVEGPFKPDHYRY